MKLGKIRGGRIIDPTPPNRQTKYKTRTSKISDGNVACPARNDDNLPFLSWVWNKSSSRKIRPLSRAAGRNNRNPRDISSFIPHFPSPFLLMLQYSVMAPKTPLPVWIPKGDSNNNRDRKKIGERERWEADGVHSGDVLTTWRRVSVL